MKEGGSGLTPGTPPSAPAPKIDRGRWKPEEHQLFLKGIKLYGRDWKKIERLVGTRTGPQIRSHAQKYFNKLNKEKEHQELSSEPSLSQKDSVSSNFTLSERKVPKKKEHDKVSKKATRR